MDHEPQTSTARRVSRGIIAAWLLFAALLGIEPRAHANDLLDIYRQALDQDAELQVMAQQRAARIEARPQALAVLLPRIDASGAYSRDRFAYAQPQGSGEELPDAANSGPLVDHYGNVRSYGFTLSQTLWSLESFQRLRAANLTVAEAEARYRSAHLKLILRVAEAYFRILSASDQLATSRAEREAFGALLGQAQSRAQTGVGPRSDVVQAQSYYDATEQSLIDAQSELEDAQRALQQITGELPQTLAPLREDIPLHAPDPASPEDWVRLARERNLDVQAAALAAEAAARETQARQARHLPVIQAVGSTDRLRQDEVLGGPRNYGSIGVQVTWPLFQGGAIASQVREARANSREAEAAHELLLRQTERDTRAAFRGAAAGVERVRAGQRAVDSSRAAVEQGRHNVEFDTGSEFELLSAQNSHFTALRAYHQARFDQLTQQLRLKQLAGSIDERDLAQIDALLIETPDARGT